MRPNGPIPSARVRIALVGDFNRDVLAHLAIEKCFALSRHGGSTLVEPVWVATEDVIEGDERIFREFQGIWCVPASPYRNTAGALWAIRYARTRPLPFLGTCGGFQHAMLEYARNVLGLKNAGHAETRPDSTLPLVSKLECSLVEKSQKIIVTDGRRFKQWYGSDAGIEGFHCSYGLNPEFERLFDRGPMEIVARSGDGGVRAMALRGHPFFVGTLFQPERKALQGSIHPLVGAFFAACATSA
jgi:CTP synthase (UTP-ammonia lyase)